MTNNSTSDVSIHACARSGEGHFQYCTLGSKLVRTSCCYVTSETTESLPSPAALLIPGLCPFGLQEAWEAIGTQRCALRSATVQRQLTQTSPTRAARGDSASAARPASQSTRRETAASLPAALRCSTTALPCPRLALAGLAVPSVPSARGSAAASPAPPAPAPARTTHTAPSPLATFQLHLLCAPSVDPPSSLPPPASTPPSAR